MTKDATESKSHSFLGLGIAVGVALAGVLLLLVNQALHEAETPDWPYNLFLLLSGLVLWGYSYVYRGQQLLHGRVAQSEKVNAAAEKVCRNYIEREFADHPELREAVTPNYPYWGKRVIFASTYYPALKRENVELIPKAVTRLTETGVVDVDGVEHPVDVVVLSTGAQLEPS